MGELFKKESENEKAKAFFQKICQIWKKFILERDFYSVEDYKYTAIDELYYDEAREHLKNILVFFEIEYGPQALVTGECQFVFGLVMLKTGNIMPAIEFMQKAHIIYSDQEGYLTERTKEIEEIIKKVEESMKDHE